MYKKIIGFSIFVTIVAHAIIFENQNAINEIYNLLANNIDSGSLEMFKRTLETLDQNTRQLFIDAKPVPYQPLDSDPLREYKAPISSLLERALEKKSLEIATYIVTLRISNNSPLSEKEVELIKRFGNDNLSKLAAQLPQSQPKNKIAY